MFTETLRHIVDQCGGGVGAVLMGYDGIAVDQYYRDVDDVDLGTMAIEYANVLKEIKKAAEILQTGALEEVSILTATYHVLIRTLGEDYFVGLTLERDGNLGKGRYLLMREAPQLKTALS